VAGLRLVRHATLTPEYGGTTLLVDPMLGEANPEEQVVVPADGERVDLGKER